MWAVHSLPERDCSAQMTYIQATQGGGGWPMNVFLTPALQPFIGGTYWPPRDAYGRPGEGLSHGKDQVQPVVDRSADPVD